MSLPPRRLDRVRAVLALLCSCVVAALFATALPAADALASQRSSASSSGYVLVYSGSAVCEGCAEAIGDVVTAAGLSVRYVARPGKVAGLLPGARAFVVPGTEDNIEPMRRAFNRSVRAALRRYLQRGGHYWGLCGGAFLAVRHYWATETQYVTALGIAPANAETYDDESPSLEKVRWYGRLRWMYYQGGPYFMLTGSRAGVNVLARYSGGSIAALAYRYGKGKVIVSGPHPEATRDWLIEDGLNASGWKPTFPLAVAMLKNLLA